MCGIVGYVGKRNATEVLIDGLRRLEYRGYDSAGIAVRTNGDINIQRAVGKLVNLESIVFKDKPKGHMGIGHTRWATHGRPSEVNAHPHRAGDVILVHNGIIENHSELRKELAKKGHRFSSETDTEIACHLISEYYGRSKTLLEAIHKALKVIHGSYAFLIMDATDSERLYVAKKNNPMVLGVGDGENFVASDIPAILPYTRRTIILEDGEVAEIKKDSYKIWNEAGKVVNRPPRQVTWDPLMAEKGGFKHFMLKEIFEQPKSCANSIAGRVAPSKGTVVLNELDKLWKGKTFPFKRIYIVACGTSWHAALVGKYWIESMCRVPVAVELSSEFRYRNPIIDKKTLVIPISQSGETADTLAAVQLAKKGGAKICAICNVLESSIPRGSDVTVYTYAGPEIGVASTKAFTAQLVVLLLISLYTAAKLGSVTKKFVAERVQELLELSGNLEKTLKQHAKVKAIAEKYADAPQFLFIARGSHYPVALEGALKLKEISYVHAEGFAAGELKHGPIALVDNEIPVIALVPKEETYDKLMSNVEEVKARGADVIAVANISDKAVRDKVKEVVTIPDVSNFLSPIVYAIPLQLFAYYVADHKGTDVDQPRNLAKSVTVE